MYSVFHWFNTFFQVCATEKRLSGVVTSHEKFFFFPNLYCFANQDVEQSVQGKWNESPATNYMSSVCKSKHWCACKETPELLVNACTQNQS